MNALLDSAHAFLQPMATQHGVHVEQELEAGLPELEGDPKELERAFLAVIENAIEASPSGETVRLQSCVSDGEVTVVVEDAGGGIPEADAGLVFDHFFTTKERGTGLGLATARRAAES